MDNFLKAKEIFLEALQYPDYARSEFYCRKQIESGWGKDVFFKALKSEYYSWILLLRVMKNKEQAQDPAKDIFEIGEPLEKLTNGKVKVLRAEGKETTIFNKSILNDLNHAIENAITRADPPQNYNSLQIVSFLEKSLDFIKNQFEVQANLKEPNPFFRSAPMGFRSKTDEGETNYLLYRYNLKMPSPIFNFPLVKNAIRDLLLNSRQPEKLKDIVKHSYEIGIDIINLWNNHIQPLETFKTSKKVQYHNKQIIFDTETEEFKISLQPKEFLRRPHQTLSNENLAMFAYYTAVLIATETGVESKGVGKLKEGVEPKTLQTIYNTDQLKKLREALLANKYIANISEPDFIYLLSGNPLNGLEPIKWIKERGRKILIYLLYGSAKTQKGICINFDYRTANNCFKVPEKRKLDSNDRPDIGYDEIDVILETL